MAQRIGSFQSIAGNGKFSLCDIWKILEVFSGGFFTHTLQLGNFEIFSKGAARENADDI